MTNDLTKLITFLNEQKRLRVEATSGEWISHENLIYEATGINRHIAKSVDGGVENIEKEHANIKLIAASANNYTTIIDMLLKSLETLQDTVDSGYDQANHCQNTINELCEMGSGK